MLPLNVYSTSGAADAERRLIKCFSRDYRLTNQKEGGDGLPRNQYIAFFLYVVVKSVTWCAPLTESGSVIPKAE